MDHKHFMHMFGAVNPALMENDFEIITWTHYPAHGNLTKVRSASVLAARRKCPSLA